MIFVAHMTCIVVIARFLYDIYKPYVAANIFIMMMQLVGITSIKYVGQ